MTTICQECNTTPEKLWQGLTDPAFTRRYWGLAFESDWQAGSTVALELERDGVKIADPAQVVLESGPYRRLSYTWHSFTPEWAAAYDVSDEHLARVASERRSKVTFDLEPLGKMVKLTVIHDDFDQGSAVLPGISEGWPRILSDLKTLLATRSRWPWCTWRTRAHSSPRRYCGHSRSSSCRPDTHRGASHAHLAASHAHLAASAAVASCYVQAHADRPPQ
jgi:uncharacterized protein YndB with AHSA1/START domain